ncbi:MAG: FixH family protein [Pseudomonadales bacterium]|nr:FixH family protein [Pseudomonadales bacterium]
MLDADLIKPWYRQFWPWFLIMPPLAAVIGGIITIWLAVNNDAPLVTKNYYQDGLTINQQLKRNQIAVEKKISATLLFAEAEQQLTLYLQGDISTPNSLRLKLTAPLDQKKDIGFQLSPVNQHLFRSELSNTLSGRYYISISPEDNLWHLQGEIRLPSNSAIVISGSSQALNE